MRYMCFVIYSRMSWIVEFHPVFFEEAQSFSAAVVDALEEEENDD